MFPELDEVTGSERETLAEWFYSDVDGTTEFTQYSGSAPATALEWFQAEPTRRLAPRADAV